MDLTSSIAWRYHQATNHSVESVRRDSHTLDWSNQPRPYKRYTEPLPSVPLPSLSPSAQDWERLGEGTLDLPLLAKLLQLSAGITKHLTFPGGTMTFRAAACTGALYHIDLYVVCGELPGLPASVYHFDPEHAALTRLREGDFRAALVEATVGDDRVRQAPATLIATSTWWRNAWKYQDRAYRHAFWDSGTILANLLSVAAEHELQASVNPGFVDAEVNALLDLDPAREAALELVPLGYRAAEPPPAPVVKRLGLQTQPYSFSEIDYPLIHKVHQATSLKTRQEVADFCHAERSEASVPLVTSSIEDVIRRRGSARRFEQTPISAEALHAVLARDTYLIVNAVEGMESGAYYFDGEDLTLLHAGDYRAVAGHLDLGQDLAADAAVNVYFLADLQEVLGRLGERGYRAAQLSASLAAGRLYLASYAAGLSATGLTFFDDAVVDFFSPHAAGKSVMFLLAIGNSLSRRGGRG
ncbi:MAG TPA: SagB family peptide dehydrogenase [Chloroflexota bacterium]|jgi:SagB-type dehydrogenase family enzyme